MPLRPLEAETWVASCIDWEGSREIDPAATAAFGEYVAAACVPDSYAAEGPWEAVTEGPTAAAVRLRRTVSVLARRALGRALK